MDELEACVLYSCECTLRRRRCRVEQVSCRQRGAAVGLLRRLADALPPGPVQLAGGTNDRTLALVEALSPSDRARVAGVAFGSVARARLAPLLLEAQRRGGRLLDQTDLLPQACALAGELVEPWLRRSQ